MHAKVATIGIAAKRAIALASACLCVLLFCMAPNLAWAEETDGIPVGTFTICDNPFEIDCGHDHAEAPSASSVDVLWLQENEAILAPQPTGFSGAEQSADDLYVLSDGITNLDNSPSCHSERSEESPASQSTVALSPDSTIPQIAHTPSSNIDSTTASSTSETTAVTTAASDEPRIIVDDEGLGRHEYATILAEVKAGISRAEFNDLLASVRGFSADDVTDGDLAYGLVKLGILDGSTVLQAIERIMQTAGFLSAQPNYIYSVDAANNYTVVDDPWATEQWALDSVNARAAWDFVKSSGSVAVAVIDTGADLDHPDLVDNIVATYNSLSNVNTVEDQVGHGTHVAGIVAGIANNTRGVAGVSYNANLVVIKATSFKSSVFDTSAIARAYAWLESMDSSGKTVAEHYNVRVVNMSVGGFDDERVANLPDNVLHSAMKKARDEFGILTVCAAGNDDSGAVPYPAYPGDSDACLSVMNLCRDAAGGGAGVRLDESSNYNTPGTRYKDICAPGTGIQSTWIEGKYASAKGTSMAAPLVAGVAAMLFAANPNLTPQMVMSIIKTTAIDLGDEGWDEMYGYGEIDAAAAVRLASASRIDGFRAVGVGGSAGFEMSLGLGLEEDGSGCTWRVVPGTGNATVDANGVLTGTKAGEVTLVSTCRTTSGAEISAAKTVYILKPNISGNAVLRAGVSSVQYTTTEPGFTWVWKVEEDTGTARIDQDAILVAGDPGVVYVTATCASNTDIVVRKKVTIVA
jgi:subtilisin family serine protease